MTREFAELNDGIVPVRELAPINLIGVGTSTRALHCQHIHTLNVKIADGGAQPESAHQDCFRTGHFDLRKRA